MNDKDFSEMLVGLSDVIVDALSKMTPEQLAELKKHLNQLMS